MGFYELLNQYKALDFDKKFRESSAGDIRDSLTLDSLRIEHLIALLSPEAENHLEAMAQKAHEITLRYFGKTIQLYTPMYLSNYCDNQCLYCGFNLQNKIERKKLELCEVEKEAQFIAQTGLKHILILTGESRTMSPVAYIKDCVKILNKYFSSIAIEIYPLTENEYAEIVSSGVDGLTIYQETYDEIIYKEMHRAGPKSDYKFRLGAPERGARSRMRNINIGVLLGLCNWRKDVFFMGLHAKYLQDAFADTEIGISIPRIRPEVSGFKAGLPVSDTDIVQIILALRIFLPRLGISVSTRESPEFRDNLLPLGMTRMSAGSTTRVGGHTIRNEGRRTKDVGRKEKGEGRGGKNVGRGKKDEEEGNPAQFEISDTRSVEEIKLMLESKGYQPVLKDWMQI